MPSQADAVSCACSSAVRWGMGRWECQQEGLGRLEIRGLHAGRERSEDEREAVRCLAQASSQRCSAKVHMCCGTSEAWPGCLCIEAREREGRRTQHAFAGRSKFLLRSELLHACMSGIRLHSLLAQHLTQLRIPKIEIRTRFFFTDYFTGSPRRFYSGLVGVLAGQKTRPRRFWRFGFSAWSLLGLCLVSARPGCPI